MTLLSFFSFLFDPSNIPHSTFLMHGSHLTSELFQSCFQIVFQIYYSKETSGVNQRAPVDPVGFANQTLQECSQPTFQALPGIDEDPTT